MSIISITNVRPVVKPKSLPMQDEPGEGIDF